MKMTLHKALGELRILESRINDAVSQGVFIVKNKVTNEKIQGMSIEDYKEKVIKASYNKVSDLIKRRKLIKDALTRANAEISFEINDETFTIATALDRKNTIENEKTFLRAMVNQYNNVMATVTRTNESLEDKGLEEAQMFFENKDNVDVKKIQQLQKDYVENRMLEAIDPLNIREIIEKMDKDLLAFEREIDYKLSELNATNFIEIED